MQNYSLTLQYKPEKTFYIQRAANSVDLNIEEKLTHRVSIDADIESPYNVGLIIGNSGSGKTTFAKKLFGEDIFNTEIDMDKSVIDLFDDGLDYEERTKMLGAIGLNTIPEWIKPIKLLSNGQKARAEASYLMNLKKDIVVIDEWTSVVDRNVGKIMSHAIQKFTRKNNKKVVLVTVHNDVVEWLNPDWIIDMNSQKFIDRRRLWQDYRREEKLKFEIREITKDSWRYFKKYHYLTDRLPGGKNYYYGLFIGDKQIGFQCFSNYTPHRKGTVKIYHSNRTVIDPEYQGLGLGIKLITLTTELMHKKGYRLMAKFSNVAIHKMMNKDKRWKFLGTKNNLSKAQYSPGGNMLRKKGFRQAIKTYHYEYVGEKCCN